MDVSELIQLIAREARDLERAELHLARTVAGLEDQRRQIRARLEALAAVSMTIETISRNGVPAISPHRDGNGDDDRGAEQVNTIADVAEEALRAMGGRGRLVDVLERVQRRGRLTEATQAYATLRKQLERHPSRFHQIARGAWALGPDPMGQPPDAQAISPYDPRRPPDE